MTNFWQRFFHSRRMQVIISLFAMSVMVLNSYLQFSFATNYANANEIPYCELIMTKSDEGYDPTQVGENIIYKLTLQNVGTGECTGDGVKLRDVYPLDQIEYVSYELGDVNYPYNNPQFNRDYTSGYLTWNFGTIPPATADSWNGLREVYVKFQVKDTVQCNEVITNKLQYYTDSKNQDGKKLKDLYPGYSGWSSYLTETTNTASCHVQTYCGDGTIQTPNDDGFTEECDTGSQNGVACNPFYGDSCQYCSATCELTTVDGLFCGDGNLDAGEQCDDSNNVNGDGCSAQCTVEVQKECKLEITKIASKTTVALGDELEYQLTITNTGNTDCTGVVLTENYDNKTSFVSSAPVADNIEGTFWSLDTIAMNNSKAVNVKVNVTNDTVACLTTIHNVAKYDSNETDEGEDYADTDIYCPNDCNLTLVKTVDKTLATLDDILFYNLTLINNGQRDACTNVVLTENYPDGVTFISSIPATSSGNDTWNIGILNPGTTYSVDIETQVKNSINYCDSNQVNKAHFDSKETGLSNDITANTAIQCTPDSNCILKLEKTDAQDPVQPGDDLVYTLTLTNTGDASCTNVVLEEQYDANTTFISADVAPLTSDGTRWNVGSMVPKQVFVVNITTKVASEITNPDICTIDALLNTASRTSTQTGSASVEELTTIECSQEPIYDVYLTKSVNNSSVLVNDNIHFIVTVGNTGDATLTDVVVADYLPAELQYVSNSVSKGSFTNSNMHWTVGDLIPGETQTLDLEVKVTTEGQFVNKAEVVAHNETDIDSIPNNGTDNIEDDWAPASVRAVSSGCTSNCGGGGGPVHPVINIVKTAAVQYTNPDTVVAYTLTITNTGNTTGLDLIVTDVLPSPLTYASSSVTGTWNLGNILVGETKTLTYDVQYPDNVAVGNYTNIATAKVSNGNSDQDDAVVEVRDTTVEGYIPLLSIQKTVDRSFTNPGGEAVYTVTITNITNDNITAVNVVLNDALPSIFTFTDNKISNNSWSLGDLIPGESKTIVYTINVSEDAVNGMYDNLARASADNAPEIQAIVPLEVREVIVEGFELPDTNGAGMLFLGMTSGLLMLLLGWMIWKYRQLDAYNI